MPLLQVLLNASMNKLTCYVACTYVNCDWLFPGHVALKNANVSRRTTNEKLLPEKTQNGVKIIPTADLLQIERMQYPAEKQRTQIEAKNAAEIFLATFFYCYK